jgi:hypothetical protein
MWLVKYGGVTEKAPLPIDNSDIVEYWIWVII